MLESDIDNRFAYHPPRGEADAFAHSQVRQFCKDLATYLNRAIPEGREKALAMTKLEEVMFWANAGLARMQVETAVKHSPDTIN